MRSLSLQKLRFSQSNTVKWFRYNQCLGDLQWARNVTDLTVSVFLTLISSRGFEVTHLREAPSELSSSWYLRVTLNLRENDSVKKPERLSTYQTVRLNSSHSRSRM